MAGCMREHARVTTRRPMDAYQRALSLLSKRERTRAGLEAALLAKGHPEGEVQEALERVARLGYLDDAKVAQAQARRELARGRSRAEVARRLAAHGVEEGLSAQATAAMADELAHDDEAAARALVKRRRLTGLKAARLLASRGFDEELIRRVTGLDGD